MADLSFGEWLKRRRGAKGWTQKQLAQQINCSTSTLRKMESEQRRPSAQIIERLVEIFEIPQNEQKSFTRFTRGDWQALSGPDGETEDSPWRVSHNTPRSNLPASITSFIGRDKELDEVTHLVSKNRLVTLAGVGGIGKTRLAIQVGQKLLSDYSNGIWFISLDSLSDPALLTQTVASIFDIREGSSDRPLIERLTYSLGAKTTLLIFDNCEHLLDACAQLIITLLTNCPNLKVLATSREILNIEGEAVHYAAALSLPDQAETSIPKISTCESMQLFIERAALVLSSFHLTRDNIQTTANICGRLDGIPLAIELAAARVDVLQVREILEQLQHRFDLLVSGKRGMIPRHQTMRASLDWSWELLSEAEQKFMRQLSVFSGGWTLEATQAVCDGDILSLTSTLVKKSLMLVDQESRSTTRYRFHEIVRQYSHEKLAEASEEVDIQTRHLKYFLQLSEQAEPALKGPAQIEWTARLYDERDNVRTALAWADKTDVEAGLYLSSRLERFWENFDMREESYWLSTFLQKPESRTYQKARAMALYAHLPILNYLSQVDTWRSTAAECLELYRAFGDQSIETDILLMRAGEIPNPTQRMDLFQRALKLAQDRGDIWRQARTLHQLGWNFSGEERLAYWGRASTMFRQAGDWHSLAHCLSIIGIFGLLNGNFDLAQKSLEEASSLNKNLEEKVLKADISHALGRLAILQGAYNQAHIYLQETLDIWRELGSRMSMLWDHSVLGYLALCEGNLVVARRTFMETVQTFFNDKNEIGVVFNLEGMAGLYSAIGKPELAAQLIGWADVTRENINDRRPRLEQADVDKIIAACVTKMGEVAFSDAYEAGQKMTMDEAVALALQES